MLKISMSKSNRAVVFAAGLSAVVCLQAIFADPQLTLSETVFDGYREAVCTFGAMLLAYAMRIAVGQQRGQKVRQKKVAPMAEDVAQDSDDTFRCAPPSVAKGGARAARIRSECKTLLASVRAGKAGELPGKLDDALTRMPPRATIAETQDFVEQLLLTCLRACASAHCFAQGLAAYRHVADQFGAGCTSTWSLLLYCAVEAGDYKEGHGFMQRLLAMTAPTNNDFINMVRVYAGCRDVSGLRDLFHHLRSMGFVPDVVGRNRAIGACISNRAINLADEVIACTPEIPMDAIGFNTLLKGYAQGQNLASCIELLTRMRASGIDPSGISYGILLDACVAIGDCEMAHKIFQEMRDSGVQANVIHYTTLMVGHANAGNLGAAMEIFKEMVSQGVQPDFITYCQLVKSHADHHRVEEAIDLIQQLLAQGLTPDAVLFNTVLGSYCELNVKPSEIVSMLDRLKRLGLRPSTATLSVLLKGFARSCAWTEALKILDEAPENFGLVAEPRLYKQLLRACGKPCPGGDENETTAASLVASACSARLREGQPLRRASEASSPSSSSERKLSAAR